MTPRARRLLAAVLLSPLSAALAVLIYVVARSIAESDYGDLVTDWAFVSVAAVVIAYIATLAVGLPTHVVLRKLDRAKVVNYVVVGVAAALIPFVGLFLLDRHVSLHVLLGYPTLAIGCAVAVSWTFGMLAAASPGKPGSGRDGSAQ